LRVSERHRKCGRRFGETRWIICAAPSYLERHGNPESPADLGNHECLNFFPGIAGETWSTRALDDSIHNLKVAGRIVSNNGAMLLELAKRGAGIVRLADFHIAEHLESGALVELFPNFQSRERDPIYAVYRSRRHLSARIRIFLDFLDETFNRSSSLYSPHR
jgi:DNA-binding transcriptional LysR family regulator